MLHWPHNHHWVLEAYPDPIGVGDSILTEEGPFRFTNLGKRQGKLASLVGIEPNPSQIEFQSSVWPLPLRDESKYSPRDSNIP